VVFLVVIVGCLAQWESVRAVSKGWREREKYKAREGRRNMRVVVHIYLAMQMHIAVFGVGLAFLSIFLTTALV